MTLKKEHFYLASAIELWVNTLLILCDENHTSSHACNYKYFTTNVRNSNNTDMEIQMKQMIDDFYNYFYVNQHICDINHINQTLGEIDNNYGIYENKLRLLDILKKIENNAQNKSVFQDITIYVFQLCLNVREELNLKIFEDIEKDISIAKFFTRYS